MPDQRKHFDIAPPGRTPVSHTSRPVIAGRSDMVRDPMMRENEETSKAEARNLASHTELTITPQDITEDSSDSDSESKPQTEAPAAVDVADVTDNESEAVSSFNEDKTEQKPPEKKVDATEEHTRQLIESKTYNLPIKRSASKSAIRIIVMVAIVLLVAAIVGYFLTQTLNA